MRSGCPERRTSGSPPINRYSPMTMHPDSTPDPGTPTRTPGSGSIGGAPGSPGAEESAGGSGSADGGADSIGSTGSGGADGSRGVIGSVGVEIGSASGRVYLL